MTSGIKLFIADASPVYSKIFTTVAANLNQDTVCTFASTADEVLDNIKRSDFDVIVLDVELTGLDMNVLFNTLKQELPKALVLATAQPSRISGDLFAEALAKGAYDIMLKPIYNNYASNLDLVERKLSAVFQSVLENRDKSPLRPAPPKARHARSLSGSGFKAELVLVAVSTGGPSTLENILSKLPADFPVPIVIVQHIAAPFIKTLVYRLNQKCPLRVKAGEEKEQVAPGTVYIAEGGVHTRLDSKNRIRMDDSPAVNGVRPAADVLFESVAESFSGSGILAVVLTGMGSDGQNGLKSLKEKQNCFCIAQSEKTCVVYGMPRAVVEAGLADKVVDLDDIPAEIENIVLQKRVDSY